MTTTKLRLAAVALLLTPSFCPAWGADGHRIVADIASHYLTPEARESVKLLLGDQTMAEASTWADEIKSDRSWDWAKPLHYANVTPGADSFDLDRDCPKVGCVVSAIERFARVLRSGGPVKNPYPTHEERVQALKFLIHLVGDLHQPLHVSRAKDRGGNDINVEFFHNRTNLHSLWDSGLIRHTKKPWREYATELHSEITPRQLNTWSPGQLFQACSPVPFWTDRIYPHEWASESYRLALSHAYDIPKEGQLGQNYFERNIHVVNERLQMAGVRLALQLNEVFQKRP